MAPSPLPIAASMSRKACTMAAICPRRGALGGQRCRLDLDGEAQFHHSSTSPIELRPSGSMRKALRLRIGGDEGARNPGGS